MSAGRDLVFAIPGDLSSPSGGYGYDRRMIRELGDLGWRVSVLPLAASFPFPSEQDLRAGADAFAALPDGALVLADGLAFGALPAVAARESRRLRLVALVHHPLALEDGLDPAAAERLHDSERDALAHARAVVTTSVATQRRLAAMFGIAEEIVAVAPPGTDLALDRPWEPRTEGAPLILSVGSLIPRKDHALLVDTLARLIHLPWRCRIVGSESADPATAASLRARIAAAGLNERIALIGAVADVSAHYREADIFALPSRYEGYGMAFAEAMAHGLPIVGCAGGAVPEVVPVDAGDLVAPGDTAAFADALAALIEDPARRASRSVAARRAAGGLPTWSASARILSQTLEGVR